MPKKGRAKGNRSPTSPSDPGTDQSIAETAESALSESEQQRRSETDTFRLRPKVAENRDDSNETPALSPPLVDKAQVIATDGTEDIDTTGDGTPTTTRVLTRGTLDATTETPERKNPQTTGAIGKPSPSTPSSHGTATNSSTSTTPEFNQEAEEFKEIEAASSTQRILSENVTLEIQLESKRVGFNATTQKLRTCPWTTDNESPARFLATTEFRNLEAHLLRHKPSLRAPFKVSFLDRAFDSTTTQRLRTCPWTTDNESPARFLATTEFRNLEAHLLRRKPSLRAP